MTKFVLFWKTGDIETVSGSTFFHAIEKAGYGNAALKGLEFFGFENEIENYVFDSTEKKWKWSEKYKKFVLSNLFYN